MGSSLILTRIQKIHIWQKIMLYLRNLNQLLKDAVLLLMKGINTEYGHETNRIYFKDC